MQDERLLVFLRAPDGVAQTTPPRYQWRCNDVDLPCATSNCMLLESSTRAHARSVYSVLIDDGNGGRRVHPPAVLATLCTASSPPWRWPELAAELRGQPDLFATLFTAFRGLCGKALQRSAPCDARPLATPGPC